MNRPAAFLDRDGTLLVEREGWLTRPEQVRLLPGAGGAIRRLNAAGVAVVILTNQSAVARGHLSEKRLGQIHREMERRLQRHGARIDAVYYCPHHPTLGRGPYRKRCTCRKPGKGMLQQAARDLDLTFRGSFVIGDDLRDLELTRNSTLRPVLVLTGKGRQVQEEAVERFGGRLLVARDLAGAVEVLLG
ncbi:MAG: HAD-IIIA family hydrolase [Planctomycetota bacterium]